MRNETALTRYSRSSVRAGEHRAGRHEYRLGKTDHSVIQSSDGGYPATNANDGNTSTFSKTLPQTDTPSYTPYIQIDLGESRVITSVKLFNRLDCCQEKLANFYVLVSNDEMVPWNLGTVRMQAGVTNHYVAGTAPAEVSFPMLRYGRYVRVQLAAAGDLSLGELQVFAQDPHTGPLITNGSFEIGATANNASKANPTDQAPWVFFGTAGVTGKTSTLATGITPTADGRLAAYLTDKGSVTQTGNLAVAGVYALLFDAVGKAALPNISVFIDGVEKNGYYVYPTAEWTHIATEKFTLSAGSHNITIAGKLSGTVLVDNVRLVPARVFALTTIAGTFEEWQIGAGHTLAPGSEQPWTMQGGTIVAAGPPNNNQVKSGNQAALLSFSGSNLSQTWTDAGGSYRIEFSATGPVATTVTVKVDGVTRSTHQINSASYVTRTTPDFTLAAGPHTVQISIALTGMYGMLFDDVKLIAVAPPAAPGAFNAFDSATMAGALIGVIRTKKANASPFTFDVVALNTDSSALLATFTGDVKVELVDASDNSGALSGNCRASWVPIATTTMSFAAVNAGRKSVSLSAADAYRDVRVRMTSPAVGPPTLVSCSTDNFAVRPDRFVDFAVTDGDWQSAGMTRLLNNVVATGGAVHKAGQPFTLRARAVRIDGVTTARYNGSPTPTLSGCVGSACAPGLLGALALTSPAATNGELASNTTYSEAGSFTLALGDTDFASVDAADSTLVERTIASPAISVGRFVPDHFDLVATRTPQFATFGSTSCVSRSFTYIGQPFAYLTSPAATLYARNANGETTTRYRLALWHRNAVSVAQGLTQTPAVPALSGFTAPVLTSLNNGTADVVGNVADSLSFARTALAAPFNANITLAWSASDDSEVGVVGNGTIVTGTPLSFTNIGFDAGNEFRFGLLHLTPAYGSDLLDLPVPIEARYWDGVRWATNLADSCTALPTSALAMGNYQKNLAACKTAIAPATLTLSSGRAQLTLLKPGSGNTGSVDLTARLGTAAGNTCVAVGASAVAASTANLVWLGGGAAFDADPTTRASFGQFGRPRSPVIYQRERY